MPAPNQTKKDAAKARPLMEEADIGSGEKSPGQLETEQMIRDIPPLPRSGNDAGNAFGEERQPETGHDKPAPDDLPPPGATKSGMAAGGGQT